jgi:hypothetical protein
MTPTLTGAQPSVYKRGDKTVRVLAQENDTALGLLDALTDAQKNSPFSTIRSMTWSWGRDKPGSRSRPKALKPQA